MDRNGAPAGDGPPAASPAGRPPRFPVIPAIVAAGQSTAAHLPAIARLSWPWVLALFALLVIRRSAGPVASDSVDVIAFLFSLLTLAALTAIGAGWHRELLTTAGRRPTLTPGLYLGNWILVYLAFALAAVLPATLVDALGEALFDWPRLGVTRLIERFFDDWRAVLAVHEIRTVEGAVMHAVGGLVLLGALMVFGRLSVALPGKAIGGAAGLRVAWRRTSGSALRLAAGLCATLMLPLILALGVLAPFADGWVLQGAFARVLVFPLVFAVVLVPVLLYLSYLTVAYRHFADPAAGAR